MEEYLPAFLDPNYDSVITLFIQRSALIDLGNNIYPNVARCMYVFNQCTQYVFVLKLIAALPVPGIERCALWNQVCSHCFPGSNYSSMDIFSDVHVKGLQFDGCSF